ncbi:MAG: glycosyltransferase family 2 protein [Clostridiaceae bacterium]
MKLVSIVIINWNGKKFIKKCVNSLLTQSYENIEIWFIDNNSSDDSFAYFNDNFKGSNVTSIRNKNNLGYSGGANQGIGLAKGEYVVIMNPDVVLENDYIEKIVEYANNDNSVGAITGKLLKYDTDKGINTNFIDSTGIVLFRNGRAIDRGQNEEDVNQYNQIERVFGVCGAVAFYKKEALEKIKLGKEYFDKDFFAYKEDIDLSWRLNLYGYKCMYLPEAIGYHARGLGGSNGSIKAYIENRKKQSEYLRGISFRNHYLMIIKNKTSVSRSFNKYDIYKRFISFMCYSLIYERFNFKYLLQMIKLIPKMKKKNKIISNKSNVDLLEFKNILS